MEELTFEGAYNKNSKPAWKQAIALLIKTRFAVNGF